MTSFKKFTIYKIMYGLISLCKISQFLKAKRSFNITPKEHCFFLHSTEHYQVVEEEYYIGGGSSQYSYMVPLRDTRKDRHEPWPRLHYVLFRERVSFIVSGLYIYIDVHNLHNPGWDSLQVKGFCHIINFLQKEPIFSILC